ncbi:DUF6880 family protein [Microbacterium hominis]|uniref:Uncharacterized protein n=1 Tax=Microbacterium hominis TaxID=162426 RepID=A0A7D4PWH5_9MICO|nr:DUF6880 family protein [Microbacterium hominis]QKJ20514.1 hypothetical protein HQM25_14895 [Microbacterium hominis]
MSLARDIPNVLASFRTTRRDMWDWRSVQNYAFEAEQGVSLLADMADDYGAEGVIPVVQKAIASTFRVLMRADDSGGLIQLVIQELLNLHAELCTQSPPAPATLTGWIQKQQFGELGEYFSVDVVDYADALGPAGIVRFEAHLDKRRQVLTTPFDGRPDPEFTHDDEWHARHAVLYNLQRLAVLRGDEEAIVRAYGGDMPRAHTHAAAAKALREAGLLDRATVIAHEGMTLPGGPHQQQECGELWAALAIDTGTDAADAASEVFERWPNAANAQAWESASGPGWPAIREHAIDRMRERPWELIAYLIDAHDIPRAWAEGLRAAENGASIHPQQWDDLVDRYSKIDPVAVLPVMAQLIDDRLIEANTRAYPGAVRRMKKLRAAARAAGRPEIADEYLAEVRRRNARRPSLIQRMDAAGL